MDLYSIRGSLANSGSWKQLTMMVEKMNRDRDLRAFILHLKSRQDRQRLNNFKSFKTKIYEVNDRTFEDIALEVFNFQARHNPLYSSFLNILRVDPAGIRSLHEIPFLPISFFKSHTIQS